MIHPQDQYGNFQSETCNQLVLVAWFPSESDCLMRKALLFRLSFPSVSVSDDICRDFFYWIATRRELIGHSRDRHQKSGEEKKKRSSRYVCLFSSTLLQWWLTESTIDIMLCPSNKFAVQLNKYFHEKVLPRKNSIYKAVREVSKVVTELLREVEVQEPRFISSLNEINGRFEGLTVVSHTEFEVG